MFQSENVKSIVVSVPDPTADDVVLLWRAPDAVEIRGAYMNFNNAVAASGTNYIDVALFNAGTAGTATTVIGGTIGGTAGWAALSTTAFTVSAPNLTAGQIVALNYNEEGTVAPIGMSVQIDYVYGT